MTDLLEKINQRLDKTGECWAWLGSVNQTGVPQIWDGKLKSARRVIYELWVGDLPNEPLASTCETLNCCNPDHLVPQSKLDPAALFWQRVDIQGPNNCWKWLGPVSDKGYGIFCYNNQKFVASRSSWQFSNPDTKLSKELFICHTCDNPPCVNPGHLFLGTPKDNMIDKVNKDRHLWGEKNGSAKLSDGQVYEMYELREEKKWSIEEIANKFNLNKSYTSNILTGYRRIRNYQDYHA